MAKREARGKAGTEGRAWRQGRDDASLVAVLLTPVVAIQAAWQAVPERRQRPLALIDHTGTVLAACPQALAQGVRVGQSSVQAHTQSTDLQLLRQDHEATQTLWLQTLRTLSLLSPLIEATDQERSLVYLDAAGLDKISGDGAAVARAALQALHEQGLAAQAGAGPSRLVARALAQQMRDERGPQLLRGDEAQRFLLSLPLADSVLNLTPEVVAVLHELGIRSVAHFTTLPPSGIGLRFGPQVLALWRQLVSGEEPPLQPWRGSKVLERRRMLDEALDNTLQIALLVDTLCGELSTVLMAGGYSATVLLLELCGEQGAQRSASLRCWPPACTLLALRTAARTLLARLAPRTPVSSLRLVASELHQPEVRQEELWPVRSAAQRQERLTETLSAQQQRHRQLRLMRLRPDPLSDEGWQYERLEPNG